MTVRRLVCMLLSMTLVGVLTLHPMGASTMDDFPVVAMDQGYCAPVSTSSLAKGLPGPCVVGSGCIVTNAVQPPSALPTVSLTVVSVPFPWVTCAVSGREVDPEIEPPRFVV